MNVKSRSHVNEDRSNGVLRGLVCLCISLGLACTVFWQHQNIIDWWKLYGYSPSVQVKQIRNEIGLTSLGERLFYVNDPRLLNAQVFSTKCPEGAEKTVVLGCYEGGDRGIYLYNVTDERLDGVIETTAAHEMLHAAYDRLPNGDRKYVDGLLLYFYENGLNDGRISETINAYKKSEPKEILNEMHSIFGTEVESLPVELERYYGKYFTDRKAVVRMAARYQNEFTSRRDQAEVYDNQLSSIKAQIDGNQLDLASSLNEIEIEYATMKKLKGSGETSSYNQLVDGYNSKVRSYNNLLSDTRSLIEEYNLIVNKRNALALEARELTQAMSSEPL